MTTRSISGSEGRNAVRVLFERGRAAGTVPAAEDCLFLHTAVIGYPPCFPGVRAG